MLDPASSYAERISLIEWAQLPLVEGPAAQVPTWLLELIGSDEEAAFSAAQNLCVDLCYDDELVGEATVAAMPFLLEAITRTQGRVRLEVVRMLGSISEACCGFLDPYGAVRPLPGSEMFSMRIRSPPDLSRGNTGSLQAILLEALPDLLQTATRIADYDDRPSLTTPTVIIARALGATSEVRRLQVVECLADTYRLADGQPGLQILVALKELRGLEALAEPGEAFARWIWLAGSPSRAPDLEAVVCHGCDEDCDAFDDLRLGLNFFVGLGAALLQVKPQLQLAVAKRFVAQLVRRPGKAPGLGRAPLVLAFPGGKATDLLLYWQVDLIELFYRDAFAGHGSRATHLGLIEKLGLPRFREQANEWLVAHGRAPLR